MKASSANGFCRNFMDIASTWGSWAIRQISDYVLSEICWANFISGVDDAPNLVKLTFLNTYTIVWIHFTAIVYLELEILIAFTKPICDSKSIKKPFLNGISEKLAINLLYIKTNARHEWCRDKVICGIELYFVLMRVYYECYDSVSNVEIWRNTYSSIHFYWHSYNRKTHSWSIKIIVTPIKIYGTRCRRAWWYRNTQILLKRWIIFGIINSDLHLPGQC